MAEILDYYSDDWRDTIFTCAGCGWQGPADSRHFDLHAELAEYSCPKCSRTILLVSLPTIEQVKEAAARGNEEALAELRKIQQDPSS